MPSWSTSQKWKVISSICSHTLAPTLLWEGHWSMYKRISFISSPAPAYLSHPEWNEGGMGGRGGLHSLSTAGCWQPPAIRFLGIPEVFSSSFCPSRKLVLVNTAATGFAWQQILIFAHLVAFSYIECNKMQVFKRSEIFLLCYLCWLCDYVVFFKWNETCFNICSCFLYFYPSVLSFSISIPFLFSFLFHSPPPIHIQLFR